MLDASFWSSFKTRRMRQGRVRELVEIRERRSPRIVISA